jgi:hypothetical protein
MSWLFSQALVEEYLADTSLDGEQFAQSNGKPTQQAYCAPDKMTDFSRLSRYGMTYKPLTESLGEELLTSFRAVFPAKTSAQLEKERELMENEAECGDTWRGWLAKYDHNSSLWRTAQCLLLEDLNESLVTLPKSGMTRNGLLWERQMLEQTIKETASGFWATPTTMDKLPPKSEKALNREATVARPGRTKPANLRDQVSNMQNWPSPKSRDWKDGTSQGTMNRQSPDLGKVVGQSKETGSLNPMWVEWLMGWPLGWTDLKPLETDKFLCVQQQPGES